MSSKQIDNADLLLPDVPQAGGPFSEIVRFAYTFDGYQKLGSFENCAAIANRRRHGTLTELRACLFFEQRRARHTGEEPGNAEVTYQRDLIRQIRAKVAAGDIA